MQDQTDTYSKNDKTNQNPESKQNSIKKQFSQPQNIVQNKSNHGENNISQQSNHSGLDIEGIDEKILSGLKKSQQKRYTFFLKAMRSEPKILKIQNNSSIQTFQKQNYHNNSSQINDLNHINHVQEVNMEQQIKIQSNQQNYQTECNQVNQINVNDDKQKCDQIEHNQERIINTVQENHQEYQQESTKMEIEQIQPERQAKYQQPQQIIFNESPKAIYVQVRQYQNVYQNHQNLLNSSENKALEIQFGNGETEVNIIQAKQQNFVNQTVQVNHLQVNEVQFKDSCDNTQYLNIFRTQPIQAHQQIPETQYNSHPVSQKNSQSKKLSEKSIYNSNKKSIFGTFERNQDQPKSRQFNNTKRKSSQSSSIASKSAQIKNQLNKLTASIRAQKKSGNKRKSQELFSIQNNQDLDKTSQKIKDYNNCLIMQVEQNAQTSNTYKFGTQQNCFSNRSQKSSDSNCSKRSSYRYNRFVDTIQVPELSILEVVRESEGREPRVSRKSTKDSRQSRSASTCKKSYDDLSQINMQKIQESDCEQLQDRSVKRVKNLHTCKNMNIFQRNPQQLKLQDFQSKLNRQLDNQQQQNLQQNQEQNQQQNQKYEVPLIFQEGQNKMEFEDDNPMQVYSSQFIKQEQMQLKIYQQFNEAILVQSGLSKQDKQVEVSFIESPKKINNEQIEMSNSKRKQILMKQIFENKKQRLSMINKNVSEIVFNEVKNSIMKNVSKNKKIEKQNSLVSFADSNGTVTLDGEEDLTQVIKKPYLFEKKQQSEKIQIMQKIIESNQTYQQKYGDQNKSEIINNDFIKNNKRRKTEKSKKSEVKVTKRKQFLEDPKDESIKSSSNQYISLRHSLKHKIKQQQSEFSDLTKDINESQSKNMNKKSKSKSQSKVKSKAKSKTKKNMKGILKPSKTMILKNDNLSDQEQKKNFVKKQSQRKRSKSSKNKSKETNQTNLNPQPVVTRGRKTQKQSADKKLVRFQIKLEQQQSDIKVSKRQQKKSQSKGKRQSRNKSKKV